MIDTDGRRLLELRSDCTRCVGLCCVAPALTRSSDFAFDKRPGTPCRNLRGDYGCGIHAELRERGMPGCTVYECFGAGQQVTQVLYAGRTWRDEPGIADDMFADFWAAQVVHELLWYLTEALNLAPVGSVHDEVAVLVDELAGLTDDLEALRSVDTLGFPGVVGPLLDQVVTLVRDGARGPQHRRADLVGKRMRNLRDADLRGASMLGADLRDADLDRADLLGADLRGADLRGADLSAALFVTPSQMASARGDASTRLPERLGAPPSHWG